MRFVVDQSRSSSKVMGMQGLHLTADLYRCRCDTEWLTDAQKLGDWCVQAIEAVGLQPVDRLFHTFPATPAGAGGVTATVLLAESHVCLHTWPEQKGVTLDVYVCNFGDDHSAKARGLMFALVNRFQPEWTEQRSLDRGDSDA
jgi:S-adenosylmethionine decarboxylase